MAQQLSNQSKCVKYQILLIGVLFAIFGTAKCCDFRDLTTRNFVKNLEREIKSNDDQSEMKVIELLTAEKKSQLVKISDCYEYCFNRGLITDLKHKFSGKLEEILVALVMPEMEYNVKLIHDAMVGVESDSCALIDILCTRNSTELRKTRTAYEKLYKMSLDSDVNKYTSGLFKRLLLALMKWPRSENKANGKTKAVMDAEELHADADIFSNNNSLRKSILVTGSFNRIRQAVYSYYQKYGTYYESKITGKYNGDIRRALIAIVRWSKGNDRFYAEKLRQSLDYVETDDHSLIRVIVSNTDNMEPIKKEFKRRYDVSLEAEIRKKRSGPFADTLIALINKGEEENSEDVSVNESTEKSVEISNEDSLDEPHKNRWCFMC